MINVLFGHVTGYLVYDSKLQTTPTIQKAADRIMKLCSLLNIISSPLKSVFHGTEVVLSTKLTKKKVTRNGAAKKGKISSTSNCEAVVSEYVYVVAATSENSGDAIRA